ncbi:MAG: type IV secretory system conjugative DNA transfer family protein [Psychrosphaera sp.]|nr:type IV secretory system conjugative DNA transfer family protein [Psychrosphaera sp.]
MIKRHFAIQKQAEAITAAIGSMIGDKFTDIMVNLLNSCNAVILRIPNNRGLLDLKDFMDTSEATNTRQQILIEHGINAPFAEQRLFFKGKFSSDYYNASKNGVYSRLQHLTDHPFFSKTFTGNSTFDLETLIQQKKVIIFNLAQGALGNKTKSMGNFVISSLTTLGFAREATDERDRVPVQVFIDECQNFLSPYIEKMLAEIRKYKIHLTLAQQVVGQGMNQDLENMVLGSTDMKIIGQAGSKSYTKMMKEIDVSEKELKLLNDNRFQFFISTGDGFRLPVRSYADLTKPYASISNEKWRQVINCQIKSFYRPITMLSTNDSGAKNQTNESDEGIAGLDKVDDWET